MKNSEVEKMGIGISFNANASNIQIMNNCDNSSQVMVMESADIKAVKELIKLIQDNLNNIALSIEQSKEVVEQIEIIEEQIKTSSANKSIIKSSFGTIKSILEGITGSIIASGIIYHLALFV